MEEGTKGIITVDKSNEKPSEDHVTESLGDDEVDFHFEQPAIPSLSFDTGHIKVNIWLCVYVCVCVHPHVYVGIGKNKCSVYGYKLLHHILKCTCISDVANDVNDVCTFFLSCSYTYLIRLGV